MTTPDPHSTPPADPVAGGGARTACPRCGHYNRASAKWCGGCAASLATEPGTDLVPAPAAPTTTAARAWKPRLPITWDRKTRRRGVALGAVLTVLVAGYLVFNWIQNSWYDAREPVKAYFDSLESREGYEPPTNVRVGELDLGSGKDWEGECKSSNCYPDGDHASVDVTYELAGQEHKGGVTVTRASSGWFRQWAVAEPRGVLQVKSASGHIAEADVAGEKVTTQRETLEDEFTTVPPGVYTVGLPEDDPLLEVKTQHVAVPISNSSNAWNSTKTEVSLDKPTVKASAVKQIETLVETRVDECIATKDTTDPGCGLHSKELLVDDDTVKWSLTSYPKVTIRLVDEPHWDDPPAEVVTTTPGKAEMSYQRIQSSKTKTEKITFKVSGEIAIKHGKLVWPID